MSAAGVVCQRCKGGHQAINCPGLKRKADNAEGRRCHRCQSIHHETKYCNLNNKKKAKVAERISNGIRCTKCKSCTHDTVNCDELKRWEQNPSERTLRNFVVSDHNIYTVPFNRSENFNALVNKILLKKGKYIGGFVARAVEPRPTEPIDSFKYKIVTGKKMKVNKVKEGVYDLEFSKPEKRNRVSKFIEESEQYEKKLALNVGENRFWTQITELFDDFSVNLKTGPRYVSDFDQSLFKKDDISDWAIHRLQRSFLPVMKEDSVVETKDVVHPNKCVKIPGITTPFIMLGQAGSATAFHVEDLELFSVNYLHSGAEKHWIIVPASHKASLRLVMKKYFPELYDTCEAADTHKTIFLTPQLLIAEGIPFNTVKQCPGDYVVTFPGAFHMVVNAGTNVAEAVNFAFRKWFEKSSGPMLHCTCEDKGRTLSILDPFRTFFKK